MRFIFQRVTGNWKTLALVAGLLLAPGSGRADLPPGNWAVSGNIVDYGMAAHGPIFTNTLTLSGHYADGRFILDTTPVKTMDDVAESAGWDGRLLYLIQRGSPVPHVEGTPRTNGIAYLEPAVFSNYATYALAAVLLSFANSNQLADLEEKKIPLILGRIRIYPEESNTYVIGHNLTNVTEIEAICPGLRPGNTGLEPIPGFEQGFTRWKFKSRVLATNETDGSWKLAVEYDEFMGKYILPTRRQLQDRQVTAEIVFQREAQPAATYLPAITEKKLGVMDYSTRLELFQWTKGAYDWHCDYFLTNQQWNLPTNFINAEVWDIKRHFSFWNGLPQSALDWVNTGKALHALPPFGTRRVFIICVLVVISVISAVLFWLAGRRKKQ